MPADILRDRETDEAPKFSDLAAQAPPDLGAQIQARRTSLADLERERTKAGEAEVGALETQAARMKPAIEQAQQVVAQPRPAPPAPLALTPPPSRKLTDFLAPVEGEQPENTISKLMQGIGLLATGFVGLKRGDARPALASLKGALQGWQEGDRQRADRAFADWRASTDKLIEEHESRHRTWRDILADSSLNVQQQMKLLELSGLKEGYEPMIAAARKGNITEAMKFQQHDLDQLTRLQDHRDKLVAMETEKRRHEDFIRELKADAVKQKTADIAGAMPDAQSLRVMGKDWFVEGKMPSIGQGGKGVALAVRSAVIKAGIEWAKEMGIDPMSSQSLRAEVASARGAINTLRRVNSVQQAAIRRFDGHADALVKLSDMVPRSEMPAVNAAILRGERDYKGSPEAAAFVFQAFELAMEFSRVVVGTAQGDAATRDEARKAISGALNPAQVRAVVEQARQNAHRNIETNAQSEKETLKILDTLGGRIAGPPMPPPPMGPPEDPLSVFPKAK